LIDSGTGGMKNWVLGLILGAIAVMAYFSFIIKLW